MHSGALNKTIPEQHDCLGKNCTFLEKNCQRPFWRVSEEAKLTKEKRKEKIRLEKQKKAQAESDMRILANSWNAYLEELQYEMQIICVPEDTLYRIFYVSDNRFADGNRYPEFLEMLSRHFLGAGFSFAIYGMRTGTLSLGMNTVNGGGNKPLDYLLPRALHK